MLYGDMAVIDFEHNVIAIDWEQVEIIASSNAETKYIAMLMLAVRDKTYKEAGK